MACGRYVNQTGAAEACLGCLVVWLTLKACRLRRRKNPSEDRSLIDKARAVILKVSGLRSSRCQCQRARLKDGTALHAAADWGHAMWCGHCWNLVPNPTVVTPIAPLPCRWRRGAVTLEVVGHFAGRRCRPQSCADNEVPLISAARLGFHQIVGSFLAAVPIRKKPTAPGARPETGPQFCVCNKCWALDKAEAAR